LTLPSEVCYNDFGFAQREIVFDYSRTVRIAIAVYCQNIGYKQDSFA